jgi:hypothetical protein
MNITALISIGETVVPAVPNDAIVTYQGQDYIFVLTNEAKTGNNEEEENKENLSKSKEAVTNYERVPVVKETSDVGYTEVTLLRKLPPEAKIIVKGAFFAMAKMTNTGEHEE